MFKYRNLHNKLHYWSTGAGMVLPHAHYIFSEKEEVVRTLNVKSQFSHEDLVLSDYQNETWYISSSKL